MSTKTMCKKKRIKSHADTVIVQHGRYLQFIALVTLPRARAVLRAAPKTYMHIGYLGHPVSLVRKMLLLWTRQDF